MMSKRTMTPWGKPDDVEVVAPGIHFYSTPSHGGYLISDERFESMPAHLRAVQTFVNRNRPEWVGHGHWYEEDCDWAIVALAFPKHFAKSSVETAAKVFEAHHPNHHHDVAKAELAKPVDYTPDQWERHLDYLADHPNGWDSVQT